MNTHPRPGLHAWIIRLWHSSFTAREIATELGLKPVTIYMIWVRAKKAGLLPKRRRYP